MPPLRGAEPYAQSIARIVLLSTRGLSLFWVAGLSSGKMERQSQEGVNSPATVYCGTIER